MEDMRDQYDSKLFNGQYKQGLTKWHIQCNKL
jgi:hypothetical protein